MPVVRLSPIVLQCMEQCIENYLVKDLIEFDTKFQKNLVSHLTAHWILLDKKNQSYCNLRTILEVNWKKWIRTFRSKHRSVFNLLSSEGILPKELSKKSLSFENSTIHFTALVIQDCVRAVKALLLISRTKRRTQFDRKDLETIIQDRNHLAILVEKFLRGELT